MTRLLNWIPLIASAWLAANGVNASRRVEVESSVIVAESGRTDVTVAESGGTEIIIIATNQGGSNQNRYWNQPAMAAGQVIQVTVGGSAGLVYSPDTITANIGDMVQFNFMSQNHTATQSSFATPCEKLTGGVDSGFMPNPSNSVSPPPMMLFQVNTTDPVWMYCRQAGHCGKGMVFSINPTATKTQAQFQALALSQNGTASSTSSESSSSAVSVASPAAPPPPPPPAAPPAAPPASSSSGSVAQGSGQTSNGGVCSCACLCGASDFPPGAGVGAVGGMSGEISIVSVTAAKRRRGLIGDGKH